MRSCFVVGLLLPLLIGTPLMAQEELPEFNLNQSTIEAHLRFLASDALGGRYTGSSGNEAAAAFIAAHLQAYGYQPPAGQESYFQQVPFQRTQLPETAALTIGDTAVSAEDILILAGAAYEGSAPVVFAGFGWVDPESDHDDYADLDVEGKIVVTLLGRPDDRSPNAALFAGREKRELAAERGAVALLELYQLPFPFQDLRNYFRQGIQLVDEESEQIDLPYGFIKSSREGTMLERLRSEDGLQAEFQSSGVVADKFTSPNVIGVLEGSDPELKDEYVLLTAHFDHVGTGSRGGRVSETDSIFNGARDNAIGTVSLLAAARAFSQQPPRRSVIILAVTGEEIGLLGSAYYADHPLIPLEQVIFNLNSDGAGYNTTDSVGIFGYGRLGINDLLEKGVAPFDLGIIPDPAEEQNLYDRSDNVSFAKKGVPAVTYSPGFSAFDQEIFKYYHQVSDEADGLDFDYVTRYAKGLAYVARLVADADERPFWLAGDKYEAAGKALYE